MSDAPVRHGWSKYQRTLSGIERTWVTNLNREMRVLRGDLVEILDRAGLSVQAKTQIREAFVELKNKAQTISLGEAQKIVQAGETFTGTQLSYLQDVGIVKATLRYPTLGLDVDQEVMEHVAGVEWVDHALALVLSGVSQVKLEGADQEAIQRLLSVKLSGGRASPFRKAQNAMRSSTVMSTWGGGGDVLAHLYQEVEDRTDQKFMRQACCAIDERTTNCCLMVNGQIVGQREKFVLRGTPRFRDEMKNPPFHHYCRTAVTLYQDRMDLIPGAVTTQQMVDASRAELSSRLEHYGTSREREEIHPAHSTSRRG